MVPTFEIGYWSESVNCPIVLKFTRVELRLLQEKEKGYWILEGEKILCWKLFLQKLRGHVSL
jgi:hypothetical protein